MKEKINQKGFIQIPLLIGIIVSVVIVAGIGTGVVFYKQGGLPFSINISELLNKQNKPVTEEPQPNQEELERTILETELEKAKAEAEKAKAEVEAAQVKAQETKPEEIVQELPTPIVTGITPQEILTNLDNYLTISGKNFKQAEVWIGGKNFGAGTNQTNKIINIKVLSGTLKPNIYDVQVRNSDDKTSTLNDSLTVFSPPSQSSSTPSELTTEEIAAKVSPAVVQIKNDRGTGCPCTGSGMILDASGYILTNEHVIRNDNIVEIKLNNGNTVEGTVKGWNQIYDLAVVKINSFIDNYITLGDSDSITLGQKALAFGYPLTSFPGNITVLEGIIANTEVIDNFYGTPVKFIRTDANIQPGSSGGPLVNKKGEVIGVNNWCIALFGICVEGYGHAIKINEAKSMLSDLKVGVQVSIPNQTPEPEPTPTPQPPSDTTPPEISNIQVINIGTNSATITWNTNESSISQVQYGITSNLGSSSSLNSNLVVSHGVNLTGLTAGTNYYYKIISKDAADNQVESSVRTFSTQSITPGTLTVALGPATPSANIVVGLSTGVLMAQYNFKSTIEAFTVSEIKVSTSESTERDYVSVWLSYKDSTGSMVTTGKQSTFVNRTMEFTGLNLYVPADGGANLTVWVGLNAVAATGYALTGDRPQITLDYYKAGSDSQPLITDTPNIEARQMILYKTKPTVAMAGMVSGTLVNGTNTLYGFTVTADTAGDIGLKVITFSVTGNDATGGDMALTTLKFWKGSTDYSDKVTIGSAIDSSAYESTGTDLADGSGHNVFVTFADEEVIPAGTSQTYKLIGLTTLTGTGDSISTYVVADAAPIGLGAAYTISLGNFIWTDRSWGSFHDVTISTDWINGNLVDVLGSSNTYTISR